jgi:hypothetical protein
MKTLFRVLVLLVAALVVIAAVSTFVQSDYADALHTLPAGHHVEASQRAAVPSGSTPQSNGGEMGKGSGVAAGPSLLGLGQIVKNLIITGLVITLITGGGRLLQHFRLAAQRPARTSC